MTRCPILGAIPLALINAVLFAGPPDDSGSSGTHAQPGPNQSLSIEENAPDPVEQRGGWESKGNAVDGNVEAVAMEAGPLEQEKSPIFLGRKRAIDKGEGPTSSASGTPWYRSSLGALGLVLALMALLYFALKRWAPSIRIQDTGLIRIMSRTVIGPKQNLVLVRVGQRVILMGVSPDRIDRVCEIADAEEVAALAAHVPGVAERGGFSAWLDREAAEFVDSDKPETKKMAVTESRSGSKSLSELLQKLRTTKV